MCADKTLVWDMSTFSYHDLHDHSNICSCRWKLFFLELMKRFLRNFTYSRKKIHMIRLLSGHPFLDMSLIMEFYECPWDMYILSHHPSLSAQIHDSFHMDMFDNETNRRRSGRHHKRSSVSTRSRSNSLVSSTSSSFKKKHVFWIPPVPINYRQLEYCCGPHDTVSMSMLSQVSTQLHYVTSLAKMCKRVSRDIHLPLSLVCQYPLLNWNWNFLFHHRQWSVTNLLKLHAYPSLIQWKVLSQNMFLTPELIVALRHCPWDWHSLAKNPALPPHIIYQYTELFDVWKWKHAYQHCRLCPSFWKHQAFLPSETTSMTYTKWEKIYLLPLFHNKFSASPDAHQWAICHIQSWLFHHIQRIRYQRYQTSIHHVTHYFYTQHHLCTNTIRHIYEFVYS